MKPDWDELGEKFEKSKKVLIGDMDCTVETNKKLCEDEGVTGYPTLKYYVPGEPDGEVYNGERELAAMQTFAKTLGPACGPNYRKKCSEEQLARLDVLMATPQTELEDLMEVGLKELEVASKANEDLLARIKSEYEESTKALAALREEKGPDLKLIRAVLANITKGASEEPATAEELKKAEL